MPTGLTPHPSTLEPSANSIFIGLSATVEMVSRITTALLLSELKRSLGDENIKAHIHDGISSYLYVAGFLSLTGREISRENMINCLQLLKIKPKDELLDAIFKANIKSHLVYVYAYYFLLSVGREITVEDLVQVLKTIGVPEDKVSAAEAIAFLNEQLGIAQQK
ncbi:MAG: hypothetical protein KGH53_01785 [Candidatus Micrarchaeota archaeon]|nr:hypothetical protein [Candidatus Micrarchaeota archaeon]